MKYKFIYLFLIIGIAISCEDFLDVKPVGKLIPTQVAEFENILNNPQTVEAFYMDNNRGCLLGFLGDNLQISENSANYYYTATSANINRYAAFTFKQPYGNPEKPDQFWEWRSYPAMGLLNTVIEGVNRVKTEQTEDLANKLEAQARVARAWIYLTMCQVYGPIYDPNSANDTKTIPYRTSDSPTDPNPDLSTTAEVFKLAKDDLEFALKYAPENVGNPSRANMAATQAMMAYYYMFTREFDKMLEYADMAWESSLKQKGSVDEMIYDFNEFYYRTDPNKNPPEGTDVEVSLGLKSPDDLSWQTFQRENLFYRDGMWTSGVGASGYPSDEFLALFDQEHDRRYKLFALKYLGYSKVVDGVTYNDGIVVQYYRDEKMQSSQGITHPELLLMRAEAYARTNALTKALNDLNTLRRYRYSENNGSTNLPNGENFNQQQLLEEILKERRRELPIGTFQRFLDIKRQSLDTGMPWSKSEITHKIGSQTYSAPVNSDYFILPIPNNIIQYNPQWELPLDTRPYNPK